MNVLCVVMYKKSDTVEQRKQSAGQCIYCATTVCVKRENENMYLYLLVYTLRNLIGFAENNDSGNLRD